MVPMRADETMVTLHEPGRADLPVGLDAQQRVPTRFMAPMRDLGIEEASQDALSSRHPVS